MFFDLQLLTAKIETAYGTDSAPTGAANAVLAQNVKFTPMKATEVERQHARPVQGARAVLLVGKLTEVTFEVEMKGSGTAGTAAASDVFLRSCKCAAVTVAGTSITYNPVSSGHESCSIYFYLDGHLYKMIGTRGTWKAKLSALGIPVLEFSMTGLFTQPTSQAIPAPTYGNQLTQDPQVASSASTPTFIMGGYSAILRSYTFDAGNTVKPRFLVRSESVIIPASNETLEVQIETPALATFNPYALADAGTKQAVTLVHGTGAGKISTLTIPNFQMLAISDLESQDGIVEYKIRGKCVPGSAGNDQFTFVNT